MNYLEKSGAQVFSSVRQKPSEQNCGLEETKVCSQNVDVTIEY